MSNMLLEPTYENLINHYKKDTIRRNEDIFYFVHILSDLKGGSAIALNGAWGSGKTFFVRQAKMIIDIYNHNSDIYDESINAEELESIKLVYNKFNSREEKKLSIMGTVYYDAWKYDDTKDPLLSLIYCIMTRYNENIDTSKIEWMKNALCKSLPLFKGLVKSVTGVDLKETLEGIKNIIDTKEDWFKEIKKQNDLEKGINHFLTDIIDKNEEKLIIFIDELDRCNPHYAVKLLERVKHYFNHKNVVFVISYNKLELQHSIKTLYGVGFDADKYLERFFDYEYRLRPINIDNYLDTLNNTSNRINKNTNSIIKIFGFQMREIWKYQDFMNKAIADFQKLIHNNIYPEEKSLEFYITWFMPFTVGLYFHNYNAYVDFVEGRGFNSYDTFFDFCVKSKKHNFNYLLNDNEKYAEKKFIKNDGFEYTSLRGKFEQLYLAMFEKKENVELKIGKILINSDVKEYFMGICSGISDLAKYGDNEAEVHTDL